MADAKVDILARDLGRLLGEMTRQHAELAMHMRHKLEAIKEADSGRMQSITAREMILAGRLKEREGLRRQITERILATLGLDVEKHKQMRLTELAEYFPEPRRSQLLVQAAGLKEKVEEIEQIRVRTTLITKEMLKHMGEVISVMTAGTEGTGSYSRSGGRVSSQAARVFEAVG